MRAGVTAALSASVAVGAAIAPAYADDAPVQTPATPPSAIRRLPDDTTPSATTLRGLVGEIVVEHAGAPLRAKLDQDLAAPLVVRVNEISRADDQGSADDPNRPRRYRIEYIGAVTGVYDLRDMIETRDGLPAAELASIPVRIVTDLPPLHGTDLFRDDTAGFRITSHYRILAGFVIGAWLAIPAWILWRRWRNRTPPPEPVVETPPPSLAEQLRPLVEQAMDRGLGVDEQARLELLLIRFWRGRLGLDGLDPATAIARVRRDPQAGELVRAVERWLHGRGAADARPREDLVALLAPYRAAAAIPDDTSSSGAPVLASPATHGATP